jgi:thiol-disulfide isomerase/thioredoxin
MGCLAAKPIVNGIEKDLEGKAEVIRVNLSSEIGREVAARYGVSSVPTLLVLTGDETIYRQTGMPDRRKVVESLTAASVAQ